MLARMVGTNINIRCRKDSDFLIWIIFSGLRFVSVCRRRAGNARPYELKSVLTKTATSGTGKISSLQGADFG